MLLQVIYGSLLIACEHHELYSLLELVIQVFVILTVHDELDEPGTCLPWLYLFLNGYSIVFNGMLLLIISNLIGDNEVLRVDVQLDGSAEEDRVEVGHGYGCVVLKDQLEVALEAFEADPPEPRFLLTQLRSLTTALVYIPFLFIVILIL